MRKFTTLVILLCFGFILLQAQDQKPKSTSSDKLEIFGGYTFQRDYGMPNFFTYNPSSNSGEFYAPFNVNGGQAAVSYFPWRHVGFTYQMTFAGTGDRNIESTSYTQRIETQSYLAGPAFRYAFKGGKLSRATLFAHELFGATHNSFNSSLVNFWFCADASGDEEQSCSANVFTLATGGGLDYRISRHISIRPAQVEYWSEQVPVKDLDEYDAGNVDKSAKLGVDGLRYSAGAVISF